LVRFLVVFLLIIYSYGDLLNKKIKNLIGQENYQRHYKLINKIFQERSKYYLSEERVNLIKIVKNLKANGLLNLAFNQPKRSDILFETNSNPTFFMKIIEDNLRDLGYIYFLTKEIKNSKNSFSWKITFFSEFTLDPELFTRFLIEKGCEVIDILREDENFWRYIINVDNAKLDAIEILPNESKRLKKPLNDYWLVVKNAKTVSIASYGGNRWYPKITIFDKELHILKLFKKEKKTSWLVLDLPPGSYYIKISDIFTLKNLKYGLKVTLK